MKVKLFENKNDQNCDPYQQHHLISKTYVYDNGKQYTIYNYQKDYLWSERFKILKQIILPTFFTLGIKCAFDAKYRRRWSKFVFGSAYKQSKKMRQVVKIHTCEITPIQTQRDEQKAVNFQIQLNERKIPLNCQNPAPLIQKNQIYKEAIHVHLERYLTKESFPLIKRLYDSMDMITFAELQVGLKVTCEKLNTVLEDKSYAIGFVPNKSYQWIAEMSLPYLNQAPSAYFQNATEIMFEEVSGRQSPLRPEDRNFVVFDDASYSGNQAVTAIQSMRKALATSHPNQKCHLYLVIPFISSVAKERIISAVGNKHFLEPGDKPLDHIKVHLITTNKSVKAMRDCFSEVEIRTLETTYNPAMDGYYNSGQSTKCLSTMEWKTPDNMSIPTSIKGIARVIEKNGGIELDMKNLQPRFITDFPPPYKAQNT